MQAVHSAWQRLARSAGRAPWLSALSSSANSENSAIWTCCGVDRPAVWLSATWRLSATMRSMNFSFSGARLMLL
jgi:hypothetical protein